MEPRLHALQRRVPHLLALSPPLNPKWGETRWGSHGAVAELVLTTCPSLALLTAPSLRVKVTEVTALLLLHAASKDGQCHPGHQCIYLQTQMAACLPALVKNLPGTLSWAVVPRPAVCSFQALPSGHLPMLP